MEIVSSEVVLDIPRPAIEPLRIIAKLGEPIVFIGANGAEKTRLGVFLENQLPSDKVHRLSAQRSLALKDSVPMLAFEHARSVLRTGYSDGNFAMKYGSRWAGKPAIHELSDYDALLQTLFAEHSAVASRFLAASKVNRDTAIPSTALERTKRLWDELLPHRTLLIREASIRVKSKLEGDEADYPGSEMSDGERVILYFIAQCILAEPESWMIIDEPEAHLHKSIMFPLWNYIANDRPDIGFVFITHDLEFAALHNSPQKFYIKRFLFSSTLWEIERIPEALGLSDVLVMELVGTRKPILFIEGEKASLDLTIFRSIYRGYTIVPIGSCEKVINSVKSYSSSPILHWLTVTGIVDADHRDQTQVAELTNSSIHTLPVAEIENILLLPDVFRELAVVLMCGDPAELLARLTKEIMKQALANLDQVSARHTVRRLDARLKRVAIAARDLITLRSEFAVEIDTIDPTAIYQAFYAELRQYIDESNLPEVLRLYDNKGLLDAAATILEIKGKKSLVEKVDRALGSAAGDQLRDQILRTLPQLSPHA